MIRTLLTSAALCSILTLAPTNSRANDIVDFLRAISGPAQIPHEYNDHAHDLRHQIAASDRYRYNSRFNPRTNHFVERQRFSGHRAPSPLSIGRTNASFSVSFGQPSCGIQPPIAPPPAVFQPVLPPPPAPGSFGHLPHQLGEVVACQVPLATCVEVRQACRIAPNAVPIIVAVRDPHLGRFRTCVEQLAYVEVCVPQCPVRKVKVSPCRTRVRLDYGRYAVNILSRNGRIIVDYDG